MLTAGGRPRHRKSTLEYRGEDSYAGNKFTWTVSCDLVLVGSLCIMHGLQIFDISESFWIYIF